MYRIWIVIFTVGGLAAIAIAEDPTPSDGRLVPPADVQVDCGYVFIDGKYLSPPYLIGAKDDAVTINGHSISAPIPSPLGGRAGFNPSRVPKPGFASHPPGGTRHVPNSSPSAQRRVVQRLNNGCMLVAFEPERVVCLERKNAEILLRLFVSLDVESREFAEFLSGVPDEQDRETLANWLVTYQPSADLLERANSMIQERHVVESANRAQNAAVRRISSFTYPSSLVGMVLAVLATGHLLTTRPTQSEEELSDGQRSKLNRAAVISVTLILFFSALDLTWTILAAQAGQMRELNPVGAKLIEDPFSLIVFKSITTLMSCGILLVLRQFHIARLASWWLCLACTIVAFRWLTFHSMFIG